jgi:hypothetical protein
MIIIIDAVCVRVRRGQYVEKSYFKAQLLLLPYLSRFIQRLLTNFSFYAILWQFVLYVPISSHHCVHAVNVWREKKILFIRAFFCKSHSGIKALSLTRQAHTQNT